MPNLFPTQSSTAVAEPEVAEEIVIDLDAEVVAEHPDADINAAIPQPPAGKYILRVGLADKGELENPAASMTKKDRKPFINLYLDLEIVDESSPFNEFKIMDFKSTYMNSLVQQSRQTSPVHHLMACIGEVLPTHLKLRDLLSRVKTALESRPLVPVELEWKASINTRRKDTNGRDIWEDVATRMTDFPKDPEGDGRLQMYPYKKDGVTILLPARTYVAKFLQSN